MIRRTAIFVALMIAACGGSQSETVGVSHSFPTRAVELTLRTPDGQFLDMGDLRGMPTVVFLFATFDELSQASLNSVARFHRLHPEAHVVGIAAQPDAEELLGAYAGALHIAFTVAYDPENTVARGLSGLGEVEAVPMFVMIDANGFIVGEHVGYASESQLEHLLAQATRPQREPEGGFSDTPSAE